MSVRITGFDSALGGASDRLRQIAVAAAAEAGEAGARFVKETMEKDGHKFTGNTAQSVRAGPVKLTSPGIARVVVEPALAQMVPAIIKEEGRKAEKPVSKEGRARLAVWARRKAAAFVARLRAQAEAANMRATGKKRPEGKVADRQKAAEQQAAFLIARSIKRRGLPAFHLFRRARHHVQNAWHGILTKVAARFPRGGVK